MSHFSLCVVIPGKKLENVELQGYAIESILDDILAPFDESPVNSDYLEFRDQTEECRADYEKDTKMVFRFPDGTVHGEYAKEFTDRFVFRDHRVLERVNGHEIETDNCKQVEVIDNYPVKYLYSFEEYCEKYCGYVEQDGAWGYSCNPNARWDWFSIGGRFPGRFLVKKYAQTAIDIEKEEDPDSAFVRASGAMMGEIDWAEMKRRDYAAAEDVYHKLCAAFESGDTSEIGILCSIREDGIHGWGDIIYKAGETLEEYQSRCGLQEKDRFALSCYSVLDRDGNWHSQGDMGWFGLSSNDKEDRDWHDEIQEVLAATEADDYLVMVDCHI